MKTLMKISTFTLALGLSCIAIAASKKAAKASTSRLPSATGTGVDLSSFKVKPLTKEQKTIAQNFLTDLARLSETVKVVQRWKNRSPLDLGLSDTDDEIKLQKVLAECEFEKTNSQNADTPSESIATFEAKGACGVTINSTLKYTSMGTKHPDAKFEANLSGIYESKNLDVVDTTRFASVSVDGTASADVKNALSTGHVRLNGVLNHFNHGPVAYDVFLDASVTPSPKGEKDTAGIVGEIKQRYRFTISNVLYQFEVSGIVHWGETPKNLTFALNGEKISREDFFSYLGMPPILRARGNRLIVNGFPTEKSWPARVDCAMQLALNPWASSGESWKGWHSSPCIVLK